MNGGDEATTDNKERTSNGKNKENVVSKKKIGRGRGNLSFPD